MLSKIFLIFVELLFSNVIKYGLEKLFFVGVLVGIHVDPRVPFFPMLSDESSKNLRFSFFWRVPFFQVLSDMSQVRFFELF